MSDLVVRSEGMQAADSRAFALGALDAIASVTTPDEAEALLAKVKVAAEAARVMHLGKELSREWRGIEIKAERKWGELLGEAENKGQATVSRTNSGAERVAVHEARKLAAVPGPVFDLVAGIGEVFCRYEGEIDRAALIRKLSKFPGGATGLLGKAKGLHEYRKKLTIGRCVAILVIDVYNRGRQRDPLPPL